MFLFIENLKIDPADLYKAFLQENLNNITISSAASTVLFDNK
jgi:hypothetical protein